MIRQALEKYPALRFEVMDARELSLGGEFDAVFSNATLHWIKEPERAIAGISKLLRTGGPFCRRIRG
jgi:trans-aconitate methyltransferase